MRLPSDTIRYIIQFLLGEGNEHLVPRISYGESDNPSVRMIIVPSRFFDDDIYLTVHSLPSLPLKKVEQTPLLYGTGEQERGSDGRLRIHADLVASSWFLLTRYEELMARSTSFDEHGRFIGKSSFAYKAGILDTPLIDRYGVLLRSWLRSCTEEAVSEPKPSYAAVNLTTDLDAPFFCRSIRSWVREILRATPLRKGSGYPLIALRSILGNAQNDPYFTFPILRDLRFQLQQFLSGECTVRQWLFIRSCLPHTKDCLYDRPQYSLHEGDLQYVLDYCRNQDIRIGLHVSYSAAGNATHLTRELSELQKEVSYPIQDIRYHYLRLPSRFSSEMTQAFAESGITDDWSPAYADVAGFRLGTSRPVRLMDPNDGMLHSLTLHPLTVMDCTMSDPAYMHLREEEALGYIERLAHSVRTHHGELNLLIHNHTLASPPALARMPNNYHRRLLRSLPRTLTGTSD